MNKRRQEHSSWQNEKSANNGSYPARDDCPLAKVKGILL